jgi:hypothetical protein
VGVKDGSGVADRLVVGVMLLEGSGVRVGVCVTGPVLVEVCVGVGVGLFVLVGVGDTPFVGCGV